MLLATEIDIFVFLDTRSSLAVLLELLWRFTSHVVKIVIRWLFYFYNYFVYAAMLEL